MAADPAPKAGLLGMFRGSTPPPHVRKGKTLLTLDDYTDNAVVTFKEIKVAMPKSNPLKPMTVMFTDKLLCIGNNLCLKHVLNLQWFLTSEITMDEENFEINFVYDDQEKKTAGKFRLESVEEFLAVEKAFLNGIEASRIIKLPSRPAHKVMSIYVRHDASEDAALIRQIENVTSLDEFIWLKTNANNLLKQGGYLVDSQGLLDRCMRPCFLLSRRPDVPEYADNRFCEPIIFLENELSAWAETLEIQKLSPLADAIRKLVKFYERTRAAFRQLGYSTASIPPNTVTIASPLGTPRTIETSVLKALLTGPKEGQGLAHVTKSQGVYWKQNPSHPGVEFMTDALSSLVATKATSAACLVKFSHQNEGKSQSNLVLASKAVIGKTLRETLQSSPSDLDFLDMESFSEIFIISLLTCPQDWKSDNLIVSKHKSKAQLVGIDNDHSFADPIISTRQEGKHTINVKNILFCLPQCQLPIHPETIRKILAVDPVLLVFKWMQALIKQNDSYQSLLDAKFLSILDMKQLNLPIRLRPGTVLEVRRVLLTIQEAIKLNSDITLNQLFCKVYPILYHYYAYFNAQRAPDVSIEKHFVSTIWQTPAFEDHPTLLSIPIVLNGLETTIGQALPTYKNTAWDFFKGDRMPIEELETLLREADFSTIDAVNQNTLISIMKKTNFMNLSIKGSSEITGGDLAAITANSPGLFQIQIVKCPKINKDALKQSIFASKRLAIYVSNSPITQSEALDLLASGINVSVQDLNTISDEPRGSIGLDAPSLFHASESIRSGRYEEACQYLEEARKALHPSIIMKYKDRILCNLSIPGVARSKNEKLLKLLVDILEWNINEPMMSGERPWHLVVQVGDTAWCRCVVATCKGISIDCQNGELRTALHNAVEEGDAPMVTYLLEELKCDTSICDFKTRTPLALLIRTPKLTSDVKTQMAKILIDSSKDLNTWNDAYGNNYLHLALRNRLLAVSSRLMKSGINIEAVNSSGETPIHIACGFRCRDLEGGVAYNLAASLLEVGANVNALTKTGQTCMHYAIKGGSRTIIETIVKHSPTMLTIPDFQGFMPVHVACQSAGGANINSLKDLIERRTALDFNARTKQGCSPLIVAAQQSNGDAVDLLCDIPEVNVDLQDTAGNTAIFYAVSRTCIKAVNSLLKKRGANPNIGDGYSSPMWRAVMVLYKDNIKPKDLVSSNGEGPSSGKLFNLSSPELPSPGSGKLQGISSSPSSGKSTTPSVSTTGSSSKLSDYIAAPISSNPSVSPEFFPWRVANGSHSVNSSSSSPATDGLVPRSTTPPQQLPMIRHEIASSLLLYGGDIESSNSAGAYLIHEIANRVLKDGTGTTGPSEFEFVYQNCPKILSKPNRNGETFLHLLSKMPPGAPTSLVTTVTSLWKKYLDILPSVGIATIETFDKNPSTEGYTVIHNLVLSSNVVLLEALTNTNLNGSFINVLSKVKFSFDSTKTIKKHPLLFALEIGNLAVCSLILEHMNFGFGKSEWKTVMTLAQKVGCAELVKAASSKK